jgi:hypothetical protein
MFVKKYAGKIILVVMAGTALIGIAAGSADAHLPIAQPDRFTSAVGEKIGIKAGLAEPLIDFDYSAESMLKAGFAGGRVSMTGNVRYADGSVSAISFLPSRIPSEESRFDRSSFEISKPGTAVVMFRFDFNSGTRPTVAYGKTLINWTADKLAGELVGGGDVLEIAQVGDSGPTARGQEIPVQLFLRGKPLANAAITATYDGAPLPEKPEKGEENNNEYIHKTTDSSGKASFAPDRPGIWVIGSEFVDESAPKDKPEYGDKERYPEWKGIRYRATLVFEVR